MRSTTSSVRDVAREAAARLARAGVPEPGASAEVLLSELLGVGRADLAIHSGALRSEEIETFEAWLDRRVNREPVQRILGYAYFRNLVLEIDEHTLIPRPDTESVVEVALECLDRRGGSGRVLDVGTGSGAIAIAVAQERPSAEVRATDLSEKALFLARANAHRNGAPVEFYQADLVPGKGSLAGTVDLLVSNPPYVASSDLDHLAPEVRDWDPRGALDGGPDGLLFYRRIFAEVPPLLCAGAEIVLEVGDGQAGSVLDLGRRAGFAPLGVRDDLAGTPRAALLRWGP